MMVGRVYLLDGASPPEFSTRSARVVSVRLRGKTGLPNFIPGPGRP